MYYRYRVIRGVTGGRYQRLEEISLFGCNAGEVVAMLRACPDELHRAPLPWHLAVEEMLAPSESAFVISLKPKNKNQSRALSLYELRDVWGISDNEWTRLMLRLRGLVVDNEPPIGDPTNFEITYLPHHESILTFLYVDGAIVDGALSGRWSFSRPSPTNSLLLWPDDLRKFLGIIREVAPQFLE